MSEAKVKVPTNEEILTLVQDYASEHQVEVFSDIDAESGDGMQVNVDSGFIELMESKFPGINLDEVLSGFFEKLIKGFMEEIESNPEYMEEIRQKTEELEKENT